MNRVDVNAMMEFIKAGFETAVAGEATCRDKGAYELALRFNEQKNTLGNLLLLAEKSVEEGGFCPGKLTNVRQAVDRSTDGDLAHVLAKMHVIINGRIEDCVNDNCSACPLADDARDCFTATIETMLQEVSDEKES